MKLQGMKWQKSSKKEEVKKKLKVKRSWIWMCGHEGKSLRFAVLKQGRYAESVTHLSSQFMKIVGSVNLRRSLLLLESNYDYRVTAARVKEFRENGKITCLMVCYCLSQKIEMSAASPDIIYTLD